MHVFIEMYQENEEYKKAGIFTTKRDINLIRSISELNRSLFDSFGTESTVYGEQHRVNRLRLHRVPAYDLHMSLNTFSSFYLTNPSIDQYYHNHMHRNPKKR